LTVAREKIHIPDEARAVCEVFGLDPLVTLSEGTLIITCKAGATGAVIGALAEEKIGCYEVGKVGGPGGRGGGHLWLSDKGSKPRPHVPAADAYWGAYSRASASGLR
jgi:hydrogenase maturation factor